jgi:hypothetical protein
MDHRIDAFLAFMLSLEGKSPGLIREAVHLDLAVRERQFQDDEPDERAKDAAAQRCRMLCRTRVELERERCWGTPTADHLKLVLNAIGPASLTDAASPAVAGGPGK